MSYYIPQQRSEKNVSLYAETTAGDYSSASTSIPVHVAENAPLTSDVTIQHSSGCRDLIFAILFIVHLIAFAAIIIGGNVMNKNGAESHNIILPSNSEGFRVIMTALGTTLGVSIALSFIWLLVVRFFARSLIIATLILSVVIVVVNGIIFIVKYNNITLGIFMFIMAGIYAFCFISWRSRIPFATAMLETISTLIHRYPSTVAVAYVGLAVQIAWSVLWVWGISFIQYFSPAVTYALMVFLVFSYYWVSQVIKNVVHVTASGTFATWYFMANNMPGNPTLGSLFRATTTSFGSVCLGSLIVAVLDTLRWIVSSLRNSKYEILACIAQCLLSCIENLVQYFNLYAYTQVAIYGKTYCQSAKDTWALFNSHGILALVNDSIVGGVLNIGAIAIALLSGFVGAIVAFATLGSYLVACVGIGFLVGLVVSTITMSVVQSGVATVFVCYAMDPAAMQRNLPGLYDKFRLANEGYRV